MGFIYPEKGKSFTFVQTDEPKCGQQIGDTWWNGGPLSNLIFFSEDLKQSVWTKSNISYAVVGVKPPSFLPQSSKVWKLTDSDIANIGYLIQIPVTLSLGDTTSRIFSVYVKNIDSPGIQVSNQILHDETNYRHQYCRINFGTNVVTKVGPGNTYVDYIEDNWIKISNVLADDGTSDGVNDYVGLFIYPAIVSGVTDIGSILFCCPSLEIGNKPSRLYVPTTDMNPVSIVGKTCVYNGKIWQCYNLNLPGGDTGLVFGGYLSGVNPTSVIDKVIFPFDFGSATKVGNLTTVLYNGSCFNSSYHAYCGCGNRSGQSSKIDKTVFSNQSNAIFVRNALYSASGRVGLNSSLFGYLIAGQAGSSITAIDKLTLANDSTLIAAGSLSVARNNLAGFNSSTHGFAMGGNSLSSIEKLTFPFDSGVAPVIGNLTTNGYESCGCNSSIHGFNFGGTTKTTKIDRLDMGSGTSAVLVGNISTTRSECSANNSLYYGLVFSNVTNQTSSVDRIAFPFNSGISNIVGYLTTSNTYSTATDNTDFVAQFV